MKRALVACSVFAATSAHCAELTNEAIADLTVQCAGRPDVDVLPGRTANVEFCHPQWLRIGQEAFLFKLGTKAQKALKLRSTHVRVAGDGAIYIRAAGSVEFRVVPKKKVDLT